MLTLYHNDMSACAQKVRLCLAEKGLPWESRHVDLRGGEHQQVWYVKLNRRAVVPTLVHDDRVIQESNVINEYLDEQFPAPPLMPADAFGRAQVRLWTKQLDEDVHDSCIAILSFGIAFRHQYIERGEEGRKLLEQVPNIFKRERRRDVIERGAESMHFRVAVARMEQLLDEMQEALSRHDWLAGNEYTIADAAFTPAIARLEHLNILGMTDSRPKVVDWYRRIKARPSFQQGIGKWENPNYIRLMKARGAEYWPQVQKIMAAA
jgi:glutathione S-transferase